MKSLNVTINNLMEFADGIVRGTNLTFKVLQSGKVLIEGTLSGKVRRYSGLLYSLGNLRQ